VCWILKLLHKEIFGKSDWVLPLEISQSLTLIQLLTHHTKSILKSLINQLTHHPITSSLITHHSLTHSPHITHSVFSSIPHLIINTYHKYTFFVTLTHSLTRSLPSLTLPLSQSLTLQFNLNFVPHKIDIPSFFLYKTKFYRFKYSVRFRLTGLPTKDETSETTAKKLYCLFPYIYYSLQS